MAGGVEIGKATLRIAPVMDGSQSDITSQFASVMGKAGTDASEQAGTSFLKGFGGKLGSLKGLLVKALPVAAVGAAVGISDTSEAAGGPISPSAFSIAPIPSLKQKYTTAEARAISISVIITFKTVLFFFKKVFLSAF